MLIRSRGLPNLVVDLEINRTSKHLKKQANLENMSRRQQFDDEEVHGSEHRDMRITLRQYSICPVEGMPLSSNLPHVAIESFKLQFGLIQMVHQNKFGGELQRS